MPDRLQRTFSTPDAPKDGEQSKASDTGRPSFQLGDFPIDAARPLKVVVIGAGFSGIAAGIRFLQHVPNVELTIYDKNEGPGGTWWSNRYPYVLYHMFPGKVALSNSVISGLACDIPSHCVRPDFRRAAHLANCP